MRCAIMTEAALIQFNGGSVIYSGEEMHAAYLMQLLQMEEHDFLIQQFQEAQDDDE